MVRGNIAQGGSSGAGPLAQASPSEGLRARIVKDHVRARVFSRLTADEPSGPRRESGIEVGEVGRPGEEPVETDGPRDEPEGLGFEPERLGGEPAGLGGEPAGLGGEPAGLGGEPAGLGGEPAGLGGEPAGLGGEPAGLGGEPAGLGGEPAGLGGEPRRPGREPLRLAELRRDSRAGSNGLVASTPEPPEGRRHEDERADCEVPEDDRARPGAEAEEDDGAREHREDDERDGGGLEREDPTQAARLVADGVREVPAPREARGPPGGHVEGEEEQRERHEREGRHDGVDEEHGRWPGGDGVLLGLLDDGDSPGGVPLGHAGERAPERGTWPQARLGPAEAHDAHAAAERRALDDLGAALRVEARVAARADVPLVAERVVAERASRVGRGTSRDRDEPLHEGSLLAPRRSAKPGVPDPERDEGPRRDPLGEREEDREGGRVDEDREERLLRELDRVEGRLGHRGGGREREPLEETPLELRRSDERERARTEEERARPPLVGPGEEPGERAERVLEAPRVDGGRPDVRDGVDDEDGEEGPGDRVLRPRHEREGHAGGDRLGEGLDDDLAAPEAHEREPGHGGEEERDDRRETVLDGLDLLAHGGSLNSRARIGMVRRRARSRSRSRSRIERPRTRTRTRTSTNGGRPLRIVPFYLAPPSLSAESARDPRHVGDAHVAPVARGASGAL